MKILAKIWWVPLAVYMVVMPSFVSDRLGNENCSRIDIVVRDSADYRFVTREAIFSLIHNDNERVLGKPISEIDIEKLEKRVRSLKELERAEVFSDAEGVLHVEADQKDPVVRIITSYGNSYYLDRRGNIIPHNGRFTPRVPVITGSVAVPDNSLENGSISNLPEESLLKRLLYLVNVMNADELWAGQLEQLYISQGGKVEMVPRVGNHLVKFGRPENVEIKLRNLEALYRQALPEMGWNIYSEINLEYEGQIICKKR